MTLTLLVFFGGFLFWIGLISAMRVMQIAGITLLTVAFALLYWHGGIDEIAIPFLLITGAIAYSLKHVQQRWWLIPGWILFAVIAVAIELRVFPFFSPVETIQAMGAKGLHDFKFPPEKIVLILLVPIMVLLPWSHGSAEKKTFQSWLTTLFVLVGTAIVVFPIALATNFITPVWTTASVGFLAYWLSYNLIYTCVIEEAFFRGILQEGLIRKLAQHLSLIKARAIGILVASLLFGVAHFGGGLIYVILASVAGIGYGLAYSLSGRLHHAVLVHFSINAIGILAFSRV